MNNRELAEQIFTEKFNKIPEIKRLLSDTEKNKIIDHIEIILDILTPKINKVPSNVLDAVLAGLGQTF